MVIRNIKGFTLVEIMIAMGLSTIALVLMLSGFKASSIYRKNGLNKALLEAKAHKVTMLLNAAFMNCEKIVALYPNSLVLKKYSGDTLNIRFDSLDITFNGRAQLQEKHISSKLVINVFGNTDYFDSNMDNVVDVKELDRNGNGILEMVELERVSRVRYRLVLEYKGKDIGVENTFALRYRI